MLQTIILLLSQTAFAGGPWIPPTQLVSTYVGASHQSFGTLSDGQGNKIELPTPVNEAGLVMIGSMGLHERIGLDLVIPIKHVYAKEFDSTTSLGHVQLTGKFRLLDEGSGSPLTISALTTVQSGFAHAANRGRLTNAGDGTTDLMAGLSLGRSGQCQQGPWWVHATSQYLFHLPYENGEAGKIPSDDILVDFEAALAVHPSIGLAVATNGFFRTGGQDFPAVNLSNVENQWAALDADQVLAGGKAFIFLPKNRSIVLGALRTIYAKNNPTDTLIVLAGFSSQVKFSKKK